MNCRHLLGWLILSTALLSWCDATNSAASNDADTAATRLEKILGSSRRLRDFASFRTERDEPAFLVLFVTDAIEPHDERDLSEMSCPEEVAGSPLAGVYHVALVINGGLVNEVPIPGNEDPPESTTSVVSFPLRNTRYNNHEFWGEAPCIGIDDPQAKTVEGTKLITLADYTGDGHAWEFRLVHDGESCGHKDTLLAGYSSKRRQAILYPIVMGKTRLYWHDNFFEDACDADASVVQWQWQCGDHGNDVFDDKQFEYNPDLEAWVMTRHELHACVGDYVGADRAIRATPTPTDVRVQVGSVQGAPGDIVSVPVTIDPHGTDVNVVEITLPVDWQLEMQSCTAAGAPLATFDVSKWGVRALLATHEGDADWSPGATLFTCQIAISPYAEPGPYALSPSGLLVSDWVTRLQATATDGAVIVPATPKIASDQPPLE